MKLRTYQLRIVESILKSNTVVLLPTGSGKTLIAAEAIRRIGTPCVFCVPTIPLVEQQATAIGSHLSSLVIGQFHGECSLPKTFDVLVTTPKAFESQQLREVSSLSWDSFKVVIFDEVHHAIKDHPYRNLALKLMHSNANPRVIGLTASLTYAVGDKKIDKSVGRLCQELQIEKIETASNEELRSGGYTGAGRGAIAELRLAQVKKSGDIVPPQDRKPHLLHKTFFDRIKMGAATSFSTKLVDTIRALEKEVESEMQDFKSPLSNASLKKWGDYAHKHSHRHYLLPLLEHLYEGLRLHVVSWEENEDVVMAYLKMMQVDKSSHTLPYVTTSIKSFFDRTVSKGRFDNLYKVLTEKTNQYGGAFRCILFVKQRITTHILKHIIESHNGLGKRIKAQCIYATSTPATASLSLSKQDSQNALEQFRIGSSNMLIATNVAEEGLDIPEANCVIYFDPMDHAVSYVQGRGRARHAESSFVMLDQRPDRPASMLAQQEAEQHNVAANYVPRHTASNQEANIVAQKSRERSGAKYLLDPSVDNSVANLNIYCKKTKVVLQETTYKTKGSANSWRCILTYQSVTTTASGSGTESSKKMAKRVAALGLLRAIKTSQHQTGIVNTDGPGV